VRHHLVVVVVKNGNRIYLNWRLMERTNCNFGNLSMSLFLSDIPTVEIFTLGYGRTARSLPTFYTSMA